MPEKGSMQNYEWLEYNQRADWLGISVEPVAEAIPSSQLSEGSAASEAPAD